MEDGRVTLHCPHCYGTACRRAGPGEAPSAGEEAARQTHVCDECGARFTPPSFERGAWGRWARAGVGVALIALGGGGFLGTVVPWEGGRGLAAGLFLPYAAAVALGVVLLLTAVVGQGGGGEARGFPVSVPVLPAAQEAGQEAEPEPRAATVGTSQAGGMSTGDERP